MSFSSPFIFDLPAAMSREPRSIRPFAVQPGMPTSPNEPQGPNPGSLPTTPEVGEPKVFPIHPDIPEQPIHEPLREPTGTPGERPGATCCA